MKLLDLLRVPQERSTVDDWLEWMQFQGIHYPMGLGQTIQGGREEIDGAYESLAINVLKASAPVFGVEAIRLHVFSEARFAWQRREAGQPQPLFTDASLAQLERPWPGGTTQDLLMRILLSADLSGNAFATRNRFGHLRVLRPDWMTIVRGSDRSPDEDPDGLDAVLIGYLYQPGGPASRQPPIRLDAEDLAHFAPYPDPLAMFRGMSWLTPVLREVQGDKMMTGHKIKFLEQGATPNLVVKVDPSVTLERFKEFKKLMEEEHEGWRNAYKTLYLGGGADATVVGADLKQLDFKAVQGHSETRIAMAAGVHPVVAGMSEGMQGSSLNAGNYGQARRNVADTTFHPLWRNAAGSLEVIVPRTAQNRGAELVADVRDVPFLRQDEKDAAEIQGRKARTIGALITQGFTPESVIQAVESGDFRQLVHTGLVSVQLQPPGEQEIDDDGDDDESDTD